MNTWKDVAMCNNIFLVYQDSVTFFPPLFSDSGSYWCRNKSNHSDIGEGKLLFKGVAMYMLYSVKLNFGNDVL